MEDNRILIVDDEPLVRDLLVSHLSREGFATVTAEDGVKGLEMFFKVKPRLVILDLKMPRMTGIEFLNVLKPSIELDCAVIVLTGHGTSKDIESCYRLGVQSFVRKPVNLFEILGIVRRNFQILAYSDQLKANTKEKQEAYLLINRVFEEMSEGVIALDTSMKINLISRKVCEILDVTKKEVIGSPAVKIIGKRIAGPSGIIAQSLSVDGKISEFKTELHSSNGKVIPIELTIQPLSKNNMNSGWLLLFKDCQAEEKKIRENASHFQFGQLIGQSFEMKKIFGIVEKIAPTNSSILITGESGTGKELLAKEIHKRSKRAQKPFHAVNCAAIPKMLMESEFFGHEKGAFTGAHSQKPGRFELADGGTLLLDEIGELPLELQGKLLRALEDMRFERVGGIQTLSVDVRIIAATNQNLEELVKQKRFREDLYYRLDVISIELPPLKDKLVDLPILVDSFLKTLNASNQKEIKGVANDVMQAFLRYSWPGNVRELFNAIEHAVAICNDQLINLRHIPQKITSPKLIHSKKGDQKLKEKQTIVNVLNQTGNDKRKAAGLLGISLATLYRKISKYAI